MKTVEQALEAAHEQEGSDRWSGRALTFVRMMYDDDETHDCQGRFPSALEMWFRLVEDRYPSRMEEAPVGSLLFWQAHNPFGYVAIKDEGDTIVGTDLGKGKVGVADMRLPEREWRATFLGWMPPKVLLTQD